MTKLPGLLLATALLFLGATSANAADVQPTKASAQVGVMSVRSVTVFVTCYKSGEVSWKASYEASPRTTYNVYSQITAGGGGDFGWQYMGVTSSGSLGIGSTNTYTSYWGSQTTATVKVKIGTIEGQKTVTCI